ncbi:MAG: hypothetical protein JO112_17365 [Planctomycetes bacterium]|nr:hypothetical protein [Planctomycetota bacterium]
MIDGAGQRWWQAFRGAKQSGEPEPRRPALVRFNRCQGVRVEGITLTNSPMFHLVPRECEDVLIRGVTITSPADSPNTDGIDPSACQRVLISGCRIDTGDDNIAIKSSAPVKGRPGPACAHIRVTNCVFLHGHGMSIGSETAGGVNDVLVQDSTFEGTRNGLRIKSPRGKGGLVENIRYSDLTMKDVDPAITITCYYPKVPEKDSAQPMTRTTPVFRNIQIVNVTATCPRDAGMIIGLPESPVTGMVLNNVHITAGSGLSVRNAVGLERNGLQIDIRKSSETSGKGGRNQEREER